MNQLVLDRVDKTYGRKTVLDEISHGFPVGLTLLTGPSGAGKSTLLRLLATSEKPSRGSISWDGVALPAGRRALRQSLGYAPQAVDLPDDLTAREFALHIAKLLRTSSSGGLPGCSIDPMSRGGSGASLQPSRAGSLPARHLRSLPMPLRRAVQGYRSSVWSSPSSA